MLEPAHMWVPEYRTTYGNLAAEVGEKLGMPMDDEQRMILDAVFAENEPGCPACFSVAAVAPRQNLKTATLEIAALTDVFVLEEPLHTWTAHLFDTATKTFAHMCQLIESNDDFRKRCRKPREAHGFESIELLTGQKIEFHARSKSGSRGATGDKITYDEALFLQPGEIGATMPILATRRGAQVRYGSSAGFVTSGVLRRVRDRGRAGGHPRSAYFEWCAPAAECLDPSCTHEPGVNGCVADRLELLQAANPAYGRRITAERMQDFRAEMPPEEFIREFLGWWDEPGTADAVFGPGRWEASRNPQSEIQGPVTLGLAVTFDRKRTCIGASGLNQSGDTHVEFVEHRLGTDWVVDRMVELQERHGSGVVIDSRGPAAPLIPALKAAGVWVVEASTSDVLDSCAQLYDLAQQGKIAHLSQPELDAAVAGAVKRDVQDRYAWGRKSSTADISPLEAVTLAAWGCHNSMAPTVW